MYHANACRFLHKIYACANVMLTVFIRVDHSLKNLKANYLLIKNYSKNGYTSKNIFQKMEGMWIKEIIVTTVNAYDVFRMCYS